jgi:hypothetical protein
MANKQLRVGGYAVFATYKKYLFYFLLPLNLVLLLLWVGVFYALKIATLGFYDIQISINTRF